MADDDYAAIYAASGLDGNALAGIVTTAGRNSADQAKDGTEVLLKHIGRENIPVYAGAENPQMRDNFYRPNCAVP